MEEGQKVERRYYLFAGMSVSDEEAYTQLVKKVDFPPPFVFTSNSIPEHVFIDLPYWTDQYNGME